MKSIRQAGIGIVVITALAAATSLHGTYLLGGGTDYELLLSGRYKPEFFWGKNISLLNNNNECDKIFYGRHTLDMTGEIFYGKATYTLPTAELRFTLRNKGIWGNPDSVARTVQEEIRASDVVIGSHRHAIPRLIIWLREGWLRIPLGRALGLGFVNKHEFTIGIFPFELGRGIALGDAYAASGPDHLGFYTDVVVDQYAPGAKFSGDFITGVLSYDFYAAFLQNKSSSLSDTGAKILSQEFGRRLSPQRGFGKISYVIAGRLQWSVFADEKLGSLKLEPYALYSDDPEQRVQFTADASSKLGTIGIAAEYEGNRYELGFDYAINLGRQCVKGWDRNSIRPENRNGELTFVNSHVFLNANPEDENATIRCSAKEYKAPFSPKSIDETTHALSKVGKTAQEIINNAPQGEQFNGQAIGTVSGITNILGAPSPTPVPNDTLFNATNRFRNPYTNHLQGWMIVGDAAIWAYGRDLKVAVAGGAASGGDNPNDKTVDEKYRGFIGLQEIYSGGRVQSAFILGGAGKVHRPLGLTTSEQSPNDFASEVSGFTNLVFCGGALHWTPTNWTKKFSCNPNILAYWQQTPVKKFSAALRRELDQDASTYLGLEVNTFIKYNILKNLRFFSVWSVFIPGSHFSHIKGKPLSKDHDQALEALSRRGFDENCIPNLGDDVAVTLNAGLEYLF